MGTSRTGCSHFPDLNWKPKYLRYSNQTMSSICNFLLVVNSNTAPFQRYCRFSVQNSYPDFVGVSVGLDCWCCGSEKRNTKLIIRVINFDLVQPICSRYINVTDGRTDRLCASRGKNLTTNTLINCCKCRSSGLWQNEKCSTVMCWRKISSAETLRQR